MRTNKHNADTVGRTAFLPEDDWNVFKLWCGKKKFNATDKAGEVISSFVRTVCEPDVKKWSGAQ